MTWPLAGTLGTGIPGSEGDAWVHWWTFSWVLDALVNRHDLFYTTLLYFPQGVSLVQHNFAWFHIALWIPLQYLLDPGTAYTLIFLAGFALIGTTTTLFVYQLTQARSAALIAGFVAAFWPYTLSHHNHPNLAFIGFVPLALIAIRRLIYNPDRRPVLVVAILLALIGVVRWQHYIYAAPLISGYWLYLWWPTIRPKTGERLSFFNPPLKRTFLAIGLATLIILPLLLPSLTSIEVGQIQYLDAGETDTGSTDLFAYIVPSRYHPLWGDAAFELTAPFTVNKVFTPFIGYTVLFLALFALFTRPRREILFWATLGVVYVLLALGPVLTINGQTYFSLPYRFITASWLDILIRRPDRFNIFLSLPIAILAGYGTRSFISAVSQKFRRRVAVYLLPALLILLIASEYIVAYPIFSLEKPAWTDVLVAGERKGGVLDLPIHNRVFDEFYMYYQGFHHLALVGGHVSRLPKVALETIEQIPFLRPQDLLGEPPRDIPNVGTQLKLLADRDIHYLILHRQFLNSEKMTGWEDWLVIDPIYKDEEVTIFETDVDVHQIPVQDEKHQISGSHPVLIKWQTLPESITQDGQLAIEMVWVNETKMTPDFDICLLLRSPQRRSSMRKCQPLSAQFPTSRWPAGEIMHVDYNLHVSPFLEEGDYTFFLQVKDGEIGVGEAYSLGTVELVTVPRSFEQPRPAYQTDLTWGDLIELVGYDLTGNQLTLYWHALDRIPQYYVPFIHLIEAETGQLSAQRDSAPRNWGYPTAWWEKDEYIKDEILLPLEGLPPGSYLLNLGMYELESQNRESVLDGAGNRMAADQVTLTMIDLP